LDSQSNSYTYLIEGSKRIIIDPGHADLFGHVREGLDRIGLTISDIDLVICTHANPDHLESAAMFKSEKVLVAIHEKEWNWMKEMDNISVDLTGWKWMQSNRIFF
jgi:hydroxyacylglutathione hydrolase